MDWIEIGKRIRKQREFLGLTREELAEDLDITPKFCSDIELGVKGMSVPTLCRMADTLNLSTDYILFGKEDKNTDSVFSHLLEPMIKSLSPSQIPYIEAVVKTVIQAINKKN